jgi:hypothetical protein
MMEGTSMISRNIVRQQQDPKLIISSPRDSMPIEEVINLIKPMLSKKGFNGGGSETNLA